MEEEYEGYLEEIKTSKINSAMLLNITLNELLKDFFRHFRAGKFLSANSDLDCRWIIIGGEKDLTKENYKKYILDYYKIEKDLSEAGTLQDGISIKGFAPPTQETLKKFAKQKKVLLEKASFLQMLQNILGLGKAYGDDASDYMD
ncbi:MAG: hypothetical protein JSW08_00010 [archaeon]|nr:MAG: hypothetical protein JSW08_00010 [archaeon]